MMKNKNQRDLDFHREWATLTYKFLAEMSPVSQEESLKGLLDVIEKSYKAKNLRGLKDSYQNASELADDLEEPLKLELNRRLKIHTGVGVFESEKQRESVVLKILNRGSIRNEDEYQILEEWADKIHSDFSKVDMLQKINSLIRSSPYYVSLGN